MIVEVNEETFIFELVIRRNISFFMLNYEFW